tara:strand:+ start:62 stop:220 length:159 start_codon:yes stop_codon:yes gene_type:complete
MKLDSGMMELNQLNQYLLEMENSTFDDILYQSYLTDLGKKAVKIKIKSGRIF